MTGEAKLVMSIEDTGLPLSPTRSYDVRTSLLRGLAEYLAQIRASDPMGGGKFLFRRVFESWAEGEDPAQYPSAVLRTPEPGSYDASSFTPRVQKADKLDDGRYVVTMAEFVQSIQVEIWTTESADRVAASAAVEDAMNPVDWRYGFLLELPYYHNIRASFSLESIIYSDSEIEAQRRFRMATLTVSGSLPVVTIRNIPVLVSGAKFVLDEVGPEVDLKVT